MSDQQKNELIKLYNESGKTKQEFLNDIVKAIAKEKTIK